MLKLFGTVLSGQFGLDIAECGTDDGEFIYMDDALFNGGRTLQDLRPWIANDAPGKAHVHVMFAASHQSGRDYAMRELKKAAVTAGKAITFKFWHQRLLENRPFSKNISQVLWPTVIPVDPEVTAFMARTARFPFQARTATKVALDPFKTQDGRALLESEFMIAGSKILAKIANPKDMVRPLGYSFFGVGFGATIVTYRNCPNNAPLALWWGEGANAVGALQWYPLLPRKTYDPFKHVFDDDF
jgi:hypothetical protein